MGGILSDRLSRMRMTKFLEKWKYSNNNLFDTDIHEIMKLLPSIDSDRCLTAKEIILIEKKISNVEAKIAESEELSNAQKIQYNNQMTNVWDRVNIEKELLLLLERASLRLYNLEIDSQYNDLQTSRNKLQSIKDELEVLKEEQQFLRKQYGKQLFNYQLSSNRNNFNSDEIEKIDQIISYDSMMKNSDIEQRIVKMENQLASNYNKSTDPTHSFYSLKNSTFQQSPNFPNSSNQELSSNDLSTSLKN